MDRGGLAIERTLTTLRFFASSPQGPEPDGAGLQGFYHHFLDMRATQEGREQHVDRSRDVEAASQAV